MSGRHPEAIWEEGVEEGRRRLARDNLGLTSTGLLGGIDVMLGVLLLVVVSGALAESVPPSTAHIAGSLAFGVALVFIVIGRSELFTENFLVPLATVMGGEGTVGSVARLWAITLAANLAGMLLFALMIATDGVLEPAALAEAGSIADTFANRSLLPAMLSAVVAGTVMTLFTWLTAAAESEITRVLVALLVGLLLVAPSLNHAIVGAGEMMLGLIAGTATDASWTDLAQNLPVAVIGNLLGGLAFVTLARRLQVHGENGRS